MIFLCLYHTDEKKTILTVSSCAQLLLLHSAFLKVEQGSHRKNILNDILSAGDLIRLYRGLGAASCSSGKSKRNEKSVPLSPHLSSTGLYSSQEPPSAASQLLILSLPFFQLHFCCRYLKKEKARDYTEVFGAQTLQVDFN